MNGIKKWIPALLACIVVALMPTLGANDYYVTIFCQAIIYSIIVLGLNFITGMAGQMNMGTAGVFALGAYTAALLSTKRNVSPWISLLASIVVGVLIGLLLGYPSLRVNGVYLSLTTIGFCEIVRQFLRTWNFAGGANGIREIQQFNLFGLSIKTPTQNLYFLLVILVIFIAISDRIIRSKFGRAFIAVRDNVEAVETCGINLANIKVMAFIVSTVFASIAGCLYASFNGYISPTTFTTDLSVSFLVMLILGGRGSIYGCLVGAFVVAFAPELLRFLGDYYKLIYAVIILGAIVFNPEGLVATPGRIRESIRKKKLSQQSGKGAC